MIADEAHRSQYDMTRVILIHGARQTGKTILASAICNRLSGAFITFDDPALLEAACCDPAGFLEQPEPLVINEIQCCRRSAGGCSQNGSRP